jgi:hypothetical protein
MFLDGEGTGVETDTKDADIWHELSKGTGCDLWSVKDGRKETCLCPQFSERQTQQLCCNVGNIDGRIAEEKELVESSNQDGPCDA